MQLTDLLRINSKSSLFWCSTGRKCHLWIHEDVVVVCVAVINVIGVVNRQKLSKFGRRSRRTCWNVGITHKQLTHATLNGKLARLYNGNNSKFNLEKLFLFAEKYKVIEIKVSKKVKV
jgi:hypothetical protein